MMRAIFGYKLTPKEKESVMPFSDTFQYHGFNGITVGEESYFGFMDTISDGEECPTYWFRSVEDYALDNGLIEYKVDLYGVGSIRAPQWFFISE